MIFALLFDATIIRLLLVPAVMHLLREDNWWAPRWVKNASEYLGHNGIDGSYPTPPMHGSRRGRAQRNEELVPFSELVARLKEEH